jgi:hypothetical protein
MVPERAPTPSEIMLDWGSDQIMPSSASDQLIKIAPRFSGSFCCRGGGTRSGNVGMLNWGGVVRGGVGLGVRWI